MRRAGCFVGLILGRGLVNMRCQRERLHSAYSREHQNDPDSFSNSPLYHAIGSVATSVLRLAGCSGIVSSYGCKELGSASKE